jgi:hypothetical protein
MEVSPFFQLLTTTLPMLAVAGLTTLNVMMAEPTGPDLENSIAIAFVLTAMLPQLKPTGKSNATALYN